MALLRQNFPGCQRQETSLNRRLVVRGRRVAEGPSPTNRRWSRSGTKSPEAKKPGGPGGSSVGVSLNQPTESQGFTGHWINGSGNQ
jgi:hypothetical protein